MRGPLRFAIVLRSGVSAIGLGTAGVLAVPAFAQTQPAPDASGAGDPNQNVLVSPDASEAEEDIVVTGLRASISSAQAIKINSDQFVDSITAVDIGALPDRNVAEALQRISGIQITRNRGEGSGIAIRGLTQVRTEVNGRDSFGASGGRALGFEDVPSELLAGVDVYKNPSAEMIEGAIGGLVNLRTRMPFDQKGYLVAGSVGMNNYSLSDSWRFNGSLLASNRWDTGIGEIGVLLNFSWFQGNYRSDEIVVEPYVDTTNLPAGLTGPRSVPDGAGFATFFGDRDRQGLYGAIQWAPSTNLEFYAQVFQTNYYQEASNLSHFVTRGTDVNGVNGLTPLPGFAFDDDGTFVAGGYDGITTASNNQVAFTHNKTTDWAGGVKWQASDRLHLSADLQYIKSTSVNRSYSAFGQRDAGSYFIDLAGKTPRVTFGPAGAEDPRNFYINAVMDHLEDSDADQKTARADLEWDFDDESALRAFTAGVRYTDRSAVNRSTPYNWTFLSAPWAGNSVPFSDYAIANPFTDNFFGGKSVVQTVPSLDFDRLFYPQTLYDELYQRASGTGRPLIDYTGNDINTQSEKTYAGYAMLRFGHDDALSGNIGVRVVRTENRATGQTRLSYRTIPTGSDIIVQSPIDISQSYTKALPSLNLKYRLRPDLQLRAAASKGLSRPPFYDLRAIFNLSENYVTANPGDPPSFRDRTGTGGNPSLKPLTVNQADAAIEYFPNSSSLLFGTVFYKQLRNFLTTSVYPFEAEVPGAGVQTFTITSLVNGTKGTAKGFEIGGNTFFNFLPEPFDGLGVQANVTYVDSSAPGAVGTLPNGTRVPTTLPGLSKWSYNLVGLYEKGGLRFRAAYNWRDDYLDTITGNGTGAIPIYYKAYGQIDASLSYDVTPNISLVLDVVNLRNARKIQYQNVPEHPREYQLDDRRIGFSIRIRS